MIPVEHTSKFIRADAIIDVAISLDLQRPKIVAKEQWDGSRAFILTFGPSGSTKTVEISPLWNEDRVREAIEKALMPPAKVAPPRKRKSA